MPDPGRGLEYCVCVNHVGRRSTPRKTLQRIRYLRALHPGLSRQHIVGEVTHLSGRILDPRGHPIRNALLEIWQVDTNGAYIHARSNNRENRDTNFQGFGRFLTGSKGEYYFRTIKPAPYGRRTPHIHFAVKKDGKKLLTSQLYVKGEAMNQKDGVLRRIQDQKARDAVMVDFVPIKDSKAGELKARFDIVIGLTPEDPADDSLRDTGGLGQSRPGNKGQGRRRNF